VYTVHSAKSAKPFTGHSTPKSAMANAMAIVAIPVVPPLKSCDAVHVFELVVTLTAVVY